MSYKVLQLITDMENHMGRPPLPDAGTRDKFVSARIETSLCDQADDLAACMDVSRSWVIRRALIEYVEQERDAEMAGAL